MYLQRYERCQAAEYVVRESRDVVLVKIPAVEEDSNGNPVVTWLYFNGESSSFLHVIDQYLMQIINSIYVPTIFTRYAKLVNALSAWNLQTVMLYGRPL